MLNPWELPAHPSPFVPTRIPAPDFSIIRAPSRAPARSYERIWASVTNFTSVSRTIALGSPTDTLAYGSAVSAGDFLFVMIRMGTAATLNTVADSVNAGNWTLLGPTDLTGRQYMAYRENSGAGTPTLTFTFSASGQTPRYAMGEVTNTIGAGSFDASDILATGTSTALLANSQTGATSTYAQIGLMSISANETFVQNGSWTILGVEPTAGTSRLAIVYQEVTSAIGRAPAIDCGTSSTWIAFSFMVKQNAGAAVVDSVSSVLRPAIQFTNPGRGFVLRQGSTDGPPTVITLTQAANDFIPRHPWTAPHGRVWSYHGADPAVAPVVPEAFDAVVKSHWVQPKGRSRITDPSDGPPTIIQLVSGLDLFVRTKWTQRFGRVFNTPALDPFVVGVITEGNDFVPRPPFVSPTGRRLLLLMMRSAVDVVITPVVGGGNQIIVLLPSGRLAKRITSAIYQEL